MCSLKYRCVLVVVLLVQHLTNVTAQKNRAYNLYLKSGTITPVPTLELVRKRPDNRLRVATVDDDEFVIIQFFKIPEASQVQQLMTAGITLLDYIPENAYAAVVHGEPDPNVLQATGVRAILELQPEQKIQPALLGRNLPPHVVREAGKADVRISYVRRWGPDRVRQALDKQGGQLLSDALSIYQIVEARIAIDGLRALAEQPWVQYVEAVPPPDEPLNDKSEAATRANILTSLLPGQRQLTGEGVVIGIGDGGILQDHIDLSTKVISYNTETSYWHGTHVAGIAAGGGIVNEKYKGYAPRASLVKRANSEIWKQASNLVRDFGIVVTNNSYGGSVCPDYGSYTFDSYILDRQAADLPNLQHVFAAGNSGLEAPCEGFVAGFGNVIGGSISSKNVISTGRTGAGGLISVSSSKGPTRDGRIKPEIVAPGTSIVSTLPGNTYQGASGTSMAAPAVTGGLALLYQRYRQLNGGNNPRNALMKALLCNGATDKGLAGPDFTYGFGMMNLLRSVSMLEKGQYFNGSVANQAKNGYEISVPSNTALVKIMLYWNDAAPAVLTGKTLVNDLDLTVIRSGRAEIQPSFPRAANPAGAAEPGVDSVNNVEQVVLAAPAAGTYVVNVSGKKVPSGPQEYFVVYDIIETSAVLTYPAGGERFSKGDVIDIYWDSYGNTGSTFSVAYSLNDGASWTNLNDAVPAGTSQLSWTVPDASTTTAKVRITQNSTGAVRESAAFTIMGIPVITLSANQCESYAAVQWTAVSGATDYEVMRLQGHEMQSVAVTSDLKYVLSGLSRDSTYYISVRPRKNGVPGRRALAISRKPDSGTCEGFVSDGDLAVDAIVSPSGSGRLLTSTSLGESQWVKIRLRNFDDRPVVQSFQVGYSVGGGAVHWETVTADVTANGYLDYTFVDAIDMHNAGSYSLTAVVKLDGDQVTTNNQKSVLIRQLANAPVSLPFSDDLESLQNAEVNVNTMGIGGADRYDFSQDRNLGRLRTSVDPGLAYSGTKAFTVDANSSDNSQYPTYLDATYNLAAYHADNDEIRLSFRYRLYAATSPAWPLRVFIRAKDTDPWIQALESTVVPYFTKNNNYWLMSIEVSDLLKRNAKDFSTSFQVRWEQNFRYPAQTDGSTIDDIRLYTASSDMAVSRVNAIAIPSCDSNGYQEYNVLIKNNGAEDCYRVPFEALINDQLAYQGYVPVVRAGADTLFSFNFSSTLFMDSDRNVKIKVKKAFDKNAGNDAAGTTAKAAQVISRFPYLEDFENGQGGWYLTESNPLWVFGTPNTGKVTAAASGNNAWTTNLGGARSGETISYLYSPCFAMSGMAQPALSFSASIDLAACAGGACDIAYVEYNVSGNTWTRLGAINSGTNWYNSRPDGSDVWNVQDYTRWHVATVPIPNNFPGGYVRFRFVIKSKSAGRAGIAIDDIHIYDSPAMVYFSAVQSDPAASADVQGDEWVPFKLNNALVAAINPHGQSMGQVSVKAFQDNGPMRIENKLYYLGRSFTISATQSDFAQPVGVRLYITDEETERLISAPGKEGIVKPASAYELAVTKYSGSNEDGDLTNDGSTAWTFYPKNAVRKVPYAQGYYLEFSVKSFSEFWFAKDFIGFGTPLPVRLASFSATPIENNTHLEWRTAEEEHVSHFEIQRSPDARTWTALPGNIPAMSEGAHRYEAVDAAPLAGVAYYRLKMVDFDQTFAYSQIVSVDFAGTGNVPVVLFPNPVTDKLFIRTGNRRFSKVQLHSLSGVHLYTSAENQSVLDVGRLASGMHWVTIHYSDGSQSSHKIVIVH
ncbi:MAG: S8 family serine peptidase [Dyadobacter sp.]|uniref:S8 family serine peptidase n=1 Tax=Dyadobacter sp. TaxID=1914288 RepID=UPI001AFFBF09|nr:S8 family serine peptidase [Dyadobacter sp.]MBO9617104.1 S8 family serine peptidase [Dyadobacter sp.]